MLVKLRCSTLVSQRLLSPPVKGKCCCPLKARSRQRTGQRKSHLRRRSGSQPRNDYIRTCRFAPIQRPARPNSSVRPDVSRIPASIFLWTNTPLTLTPLPCLLEKAGAWGESQHGWHRRRTFHFSGCVPVRSNSASVSRSNQKQALIWSSALEFERKPDLRATGFQLPLSVEAHLSGCGDGSICSVNAFFVPN
jgi:hypothetical protein